MPSMVLHNFWSWYPNTHTHSVLTITSQCIHLAAERCSNEYGIAQEEIHLNFFGDDADDDNYRWNTIAIWMRIWIDRCCGVCVCAAKAQYELVNIWLPILVCCDALKPIITTSYKSKFVAVMLFRDINMLDAPCLMRMSYLDKCGVSSHRESVFDLLLYSPIRDGIAHCTSKGESPQMSIYVIILLRIYRATERGRAAQRLISSDTYSSVFVWVYCYYCHPYFMFAIFSLSLHRWLPHTIRTAFN